MIKKHFKLLVSTFLVGILFGTSMMVVIAGSSSSDYGYYGPIKGYSYKNQATVATGKYLYGHTTVDNQVNEKVDPGYFGVKARLYKSDALCYSTDMFYNSSYATGISTSTQSYSNGCGTGSYSSKGQTAAYNGNGYDVYNTFVTPYLDH